MCQECVEAVNAVKAVEAFEAKPRIPIDTPKAITFFSVHDEWVYTAVVDNRVCDLCLPYDNQPLTGDMLRSLFPDLEIEGLERIHPHVHPNCRCHVDRVLYYGDVGTEL